jgi:hypothetical protein
MSHATDGPQLANRLNPLLPPVIITVPDESPAPTRGRFAVSVLVVGLVALGIGLRAVPLVQNRNLWIDEAMLALNLVERSPARLLQPLDWNQGAPAGFLLATKLAIEAVGPTEIGLRLVAFLGSALGLIAFAWVARRLLPRPAATFGLALFAVSPFLISYAAECKQYATDAAITVGLFAVAAGLLRGERGTWRWVLLGLAGAAAVWCSHPSAFVLGGIGTALLAEAALTQDRKRFLAACGTVGCWLVSFAACYVLFLRQLGTNQYLLDYWAGHFLPLPPNEVGDVAWLLDHFFAFFQYPGGLGGTEVKAGGIAAVLYLVGIYGLWKDRRTLAVALVLPAVFALLASGLHKYPFSGRLLLFLVPLMLLGVARGAWSVGSALWSAQPVAAAILFGVLTVAPVIETWQEFRRPMRYEQLTPVLAEVREQWQPGDRVYVYYGAVPAFTFYTRDNPVFPPGAVTLGTEFRDSRTGYRDELAALKGHHRVWVVFSHRHRDEESLVRAYAEGMGRCEQVVREAGATAFLFDFCATTEPPR